MTTQHVPDPIADPSPEPAPRKLPLVGDIDAGICVDGVCSIPNE